MKYFLIHGLGQTDESWQTVQRKVNRETDCPNLYSFMKQSAEYPALYENFAKWCSRFKEPLNLCGLSLGGVLALDYTSHFPKRVKTLVLIGTPYKIPKLLFGFQNMVFHLMPEKTYKSIGVSKENMITLAGSMKNLNIPEMAAKISCKTLILCGEKDRTNYKAGQMLCKAIPNSVFKAVQEASHEVNVDNPVTLADILNKFWK